MAARLLLTLAAAAGSQDGIYGFGSATVGLSDTAILQRLKALYSAKLRPLEKKCQYNALQEPALSDAWFDAKPVVMLLGQYSVGKTSFIRYLLGRDFPRQHIGPEPTTDCFLAVMYGDQEKTTPGNALTSQPDTPFHSLRRFGNTLLDKLEAVFVPAPILRRITLVDTPGIQAGERQKGRGYDLLAVMKWWAQHADRIVLIFDPFKMSDISSEFRDVIEQLREHQSKVRVVLNKADNVESQKLMRVYGALMWSLGSIVCSPEVPRVYIGSFIDEPWVFPGLASLMDAEELDLVHELDSLPEDNVMRKINEIARRASNVKVHVHLLAYMRECVLSKWMGRKQAQEWVCTPEGMRHCYETVERMYGLSAGDFPSARKLAEKLHDFDFNELYKPSLKRSKSMSLLQELIDEDIPKLIKQLTLLQKRQKGGNARPSFRPVRKRRPYPTEAHETSRVGVAPEATSSARPASSRYSRFMSAQAQRSNQRSQATSLPDNSPDEGSHASTFLQSPPMQPETQAPWTSVAPGADNALASQPTEPSGAECDSDTEVVSNVTPLEAMPGPSSYPYAATVNQGAHPQQSMQQMPQQTQQTQPYPGASGTSYVEAQATGHASAPFSGQPVSRFEHQADGSSQTFQGAPFSGQPGSSHPAQPGSSYPAQPGSSYPAFNQGLSSTYQEQSISSAFAPRSSPIPETSQNYGSTLDQSYRTGGNAGDNPQSDGRVNRMVDGYIGLEGTRGSQESTYTMQNGNGSARSVTEAGEGNQVQPNGQVDPPKGFPSAGVLEDPQSGEAR